MQKNLEISVPCTEAVAITLIEIEKRENAVQTLFCCDNEWEIEEF